MFVQYCLVIPGSEMASQQVLTLLFKVRILARDQRPPLVTQSENIHPETNRLVRYFREEWAFLLPDLLSCYSWLASTG
jgi:hypothetical protein